MTGSTWGAELRVLTLGPFPAAAAMSMFLRPALTFGLQRWTASPWKGWDWPRSRGASASGPTASAVAQGHAYRTLRTNKVFYFVYFDDSLGCSLGLPRPWTAPPPTSTLGSLSVWERRIQKTRRAPLRPSRRRPAT